jgi:hypothetical protein
MSDYAAESAIYCGLFVLEFHICHFSVRLRLEIDFISITVFIVTPKCSGIERQHPEIKMIYDDNMPVYSGNGVAYWFGNACPSEIVRSMPIWFDAHARVAVLRKALAEAPGTPALWLDFAEALADAGEPHEAASAFERGYRLNPMACPMPLIGRLTSRDSLVRARDYAQSLVAHGVLFSPVIASLAITEGLLANEMAVRILIDYKRFFTCGEISTPENLSRSEFHSLLATELKTNLKYYGQPESRSIRNGWRQTGVMESSSAAGGRLGATIQAQVDRYIAALPEDPTHPFLASRPSRYVLESWSVVSDGASYHAAHFHHRAWASGVYYVVRPPSSRNPGMNCGWLHVGPPDGMDAIPGWDSRLVEPEPGTLVLMPGYFFHRTFPMGIDEERICIAFDVVPAEIAETAPHPEY